MVPPGVFSGGGSSMSQRSKPSPPRRNWQLILACACNAGLVGLLFWSRSGSESQAQAPPAPQAGPITQTSAPPPVSATYTQRVVAYIYGNMPITREMLGEYLIARCGAEKLDNLINKCIIEETCKVHNITITPQEIEADLTETVAGLSLNQTEFVERILKIYKK